MISLKLAVKLNKIIFEATGGAFGLRDEHLLSSALNRSFQTFDGKDLYPSIIDKASSIFQSIIINHPFIDGNKRMAYAFMKLLLIEEGFVLDASEDETYEFIIKASKGELSFEGIKKWITEHLQK